MRVPSPSTLLVLFDTTETSESSPSWAKIGAALYVGGYSARGDFLGAVPGNSGMWIARYDMDGNRLWYDSFGSLESPGYVNMFATDNAGNVYGVGQTAGSIGGAFPIGQGDGFIRKWTPDGIHLWTRFYGTPQADDLHSIQVVDGRLFVAGATQGNFGGTNSGSVDGFVASLDLEGNIERVRQFGTERIDWPRDVRVHDDRVFVSGMTEGSLVALSSGGVDAFISVFPLGDVLPPPSSPSGVGDFWSLLH